MGEPMESRIRVRTCIASANENQRNPESLLLFKGPPAVPSGSAKTTAATGAAELPNLSQPTSSTSKALFPPPFLCYSQEATGQQGRVALPGLCVANVIAQSAVRDCVFVSSIPAAVLDINSCCPGGGGGVIKPTYDTNLRPMHDATEKMTS